MKGPLNSRLDKLEAAFPDPSARPKRVVRIVASDEEEAEARALTAADGLDPDNGDITIIRLIAFSPRQNECSATDHDKPARCTSL